MGVFREFEKESSLGCRARRWFFLFTKISKQKKTKKKQLRKKKETYMHQQDKK
jgi:hypothetical protein